MARLFFLFACLSFWTAVSIAIRHPHGHYQHHHPPNHNATALSLDSLTRRADKVPLRILALGASITWGLKSTSGNGYRKPLRDKLRSGAWEVDMVGTKVNGDMLDNEVEAHSGDTIDQVRVAAMGSLNYRPNVVLINAGTNDCRLEIDVQGAGIRMRNLINTILSAPGMEKTTIVLSTLLASTHGVIAMHQPTVNMQYRSLVETMRADGVSIVLADMDPLYPSKGHGWIGFPGDFADDTHPNDVGYLKMAYIWWQAIEEASDRGYLVTPGEMDSVSGTCDKSYGDGIYAGGLTQRGSGEEDGIYYHSSQSMGVVLSITSEFDRGQWFFARLFDRGRDDLLGWFEKDDGTVWYGTWKNMGDGGFDKIGDTNVADDCIQAGVNFIDINADGLDDFVCIAKDGTAYASINQGDGSGSRPPSFRQIGKIKDSEGYPQSRVRLADVDGDGRADYCVLEDNGDIRCWRNGWINDIPKYWQPLGKRFTGKGMGDINGVRFEDVNGDGRDDWLWLDEVGQTTMYSNARSCQKGQEGDGLNIVWRPGYAKGHSSGPTHHGMGGYASRDDEELRSRLDYVFMEHVKEEDNQHRFNMRVWKNTGAGGTKIKADGNRYCNMLGHDNGMMDYVWILSKGDMHLYTNQGKTTVENDGPNFWGPNYKIFDPMSEIGRDLDRRDLHLADWDGDGVCDIIWTDPSNQNRVQLWRNRYKQDGQFNWEHDPNPAPQLYCPETRGLGFFDRPVHFADISGNRLADYLCVEKDGRTWGFIHNEGGGWDYLDQIKFAEEKDRANLQWADVNGDGMADLIHTNKFNGDGTVWLNRGRKDIGGSRWHWDPQGVRFQGAQAGSCTYFPDLDGNGRADLHVITHSMRNTAETWFSRCGRVNKQGDDGIVTDPNLPQMPPDSDGNQGGGDDDDDPNDTDGLGIGDPCIDNFDKLDEIPDSAGACATQYVLATMLTMLNNDLQNYTEILADGYEGKFKRYAQAVVRGAPQSVRDVYMEHGTEFFNCIVEEPRGWCTRCFTATNDHAKEYECRYCEEDGDAEFGLINVTEPCPPDRSMRASSSDAKNPFWQTSYWSFKNDQTQASFYNLLFEETGVAVENIELGVYKKIGDTLCREYWECYYGTGPDHGVPTVTKGFEEEDVTDPKDVIAELLDSVGIIREGLEIALISMRVGSARSWDGEEMIDAASLAVLSIHQSVESMAQVVDVAEEIEEAERKAAIMWFLTALFILVPIGGWAISAIPRLASVGRLIGLAGEVGMVGLDLYSMVDDPGSAPFLVFSYILGGGLTDAVRVAKAARARRGMRPDDIKRMGDVFANGMTKIDNLMMSCKR